MPRGSRHTHGSKQVAKSGGKQKSPKTPSGGPPKRVWKLALAALAVFAIALAVWPKHEDDKSKNAKQLEKPSGPSRPAYLGAMPIALPTARVDGLVTDLATGQPLATANVCIERDAIGLTSEESRQPRCTLVRVDGRYSFEGLAPGRYWVDISADGYRPALFADGKGHDALDLGAGEVRAGIDVALEKGGFRLVGKVHDGRGNALEGVTIKLDVGVVATVVTSDSLGEFSAWTMGGSAFLSATAPGFAVVERSLNLPSPNVVDVTLTPEATLTGHVVDAATKIPIAGALVHALAEGDDGSETVARTDATGAFRLAELRPGAYRPWTDALDAYGQASATVVLAAGGTEDLVIETRRAFHVVAQIQGKAKCLGGSATLNSHGIGSSFDARIDETGAALFSAVLPGTYDVSVACDGRFLSIGAPLVVEHDLTGVPLPIGDEGVTVSGLVVDASGAPMPKVAVMINGWFGEGGSTHANLMTKADGTFVVEGLLDGEYDLQVDDERFPMAAEHATIEGGKTPAPMRLVVAASGRIEGVVVDELGRAMPGMIITSYVDRGRSVTSDAGGAFTLLGLPAGDAALSIFDGANNYVSGADLVVKITIGKTAAARFVLPRRDAIISGRVVDGSGASVAYARVGSDVAENGAGLMPNHSAGVLTDAQGHFTLSGLTVEPHFVRATVAGVGEANAANVSPGASIELRVRAGAHLDGTITLGAGATMPTSIEAYLSSDSASRDQVFIHTDGRFDFTMLPPGKYRVDVRSTDGHGFADVEIGDGAHAVVNVTLSGLVTLVGTIKDSSGQPIAGAFVAVTDPEEGRLSTAADASGHFELVGLSPRAAKLLVEAYPQGEGEGGSILFDVVAGSTGKLEVGSVVLGVNVEPPPGGDGPNQINPIDENQPKHEEPPAPHLESGLEPPAALPPPPPAVVDPASDG